MTFNELAKELGARSRRHRHALRLVVQAWEKHRRHCCEVDRDNAAIVLNASATLAYKAEKGNGPYGSIILFIIFAAALTWAVETFLTWIWNRRHHALAITFDGTEP